MGLFERYLTVWVFLCILVGIGAGQLMPDTFQAIGRLEFAQVNIPVGFLIWVMIIPMLLKVDFKALKFPVITNVEGVYVTSPDALESAIFADRQVTEHEGQLMRMLCLILGCPVPLTLES